MIGVLEVVPGKGGIFDVHVDGELVFTAVVVATPLAEPLGMALPPLDALLLLLPFPLIVWGSDELWRANRRRHKRTR